MAITLRKFLKNLRGSISPYPLELFLFLDLPQSNSAEKNMSKCGAFPPPEKNSENAPYTKPFQRAYLRPFPGVNV